MLIFTSLRVKSICSHLGWVNKLIFRYAQEGKRFQSETSIWCKLSIKQLILCLHLLLKINVKSVKLF